MIKYTKLTQEHDANFDYAMGILNDANVGLPAIDPKENKCVYRDENLTILLRATGYNKALFVLRMANPGSEKPATLYTGEFKYEPTA